MNQPFWLRCTLHASCAGILSVALLTGCNGKIPTWSELTSQKQATPESAQPTQTSPQLPVPPASSAAPPAKPDPATVIARFDEIPPGAHTDDTLGQLLQLDEGLEQVTAINASNSKVTDHGMKNLYKLTNLQRLELSGTNVGDQGCEGIGKVSSLQELTLSGGKISDIGITYLKDLTQLKRLVINGTQLTLAGWEIIGQLPALEEIWIQQSSINDAGMEALCNATTLQSLYMNDTAITDRGLQAFRKLEQLRVLNLSGCKVTCQGLASVVKGKGLMSLVDMSVQRTPLNTQGAKAIGGMDGLERLNIAELSGMTDAHFRMIVSGKKNLKWLNMHTNPGVTNAGIAALREMTELEHIDLGNNPQINNGCLQTFVKMKNLRHLSYGNSGITAAGIEQLRRELPQLNQGLPRTAAELE